MLSALTSWTVVLNAQFHLYSQPADRLPDNAQTELIEMGH